MTGAWMEMLTDFMLGALLVVTITYCWVLNRRIKVLQDSRGELAKLIKHFDESTEKASSSVIALQSTSKRISQTIQERVEKANFIADDLAFLIDKANKLADRLQENMKDAKPVSSRFAEPSAVRRTASTVTPVPDFKPQAQTAPESVTKVAVRGTARETLATLKKESTEIPATQATNAALEDVLRRINKGELNGAAENATVTEEERVQIRRPREGDKTRSRAEQELLDIIKAGSRV